jgi:hypothetical protein
LSCASRVSNARAAQHPLNRLQQPVRPRHGIPLRGSRREQSQSCSQTHPLACIRPAREPPSSRQAPCLAALRADENSAAARLPKQVRLLRICSRTTLASDGYRSSGGGLVDHAFAAQHRNNLVLTNGAPSQPAVESVGPDSASRGSHAPCTMQANRPERKKGRVRLLRVPDEQRHDGRRHLPACLAGFRRSGTWQRVCCAILQGCPLLRRLLLRGW